MKNIISIITLLSSVSALANPAENNNLQEKIKSEFGECYTKFQPNLSACTASTCAYPDLTDSKAWKAQIIRGVVNNKCYAIYYSYVANKVLGDPVHCLYSKSQLDSLNVYHKTLFSSNSAIEVNDARDKIARINYSSCKTVPQKQNSNSEQQ
jgi:hypothetical protein